MRRVAATVNLTLVLVLLMGCGNPDLLKESGTPSVAPTASPSESVSPEASPSPSSGASWSTFSDPQGRFSFEYPAGWHVESRAEGRDFYPVTVFSFDPDSNEGSFTGKSSLDVIIFKDENEVGPLARPSPTTAAGGQAEYEVWRRGQPDPYDRHGREIELVATARFTRRTFVFHVQIATGTRPPDDALDIFRHVLNTFEVK